MYRDRSLGKKKKSIKMGMFNRFCDFSIEFTLFVILFVLAATAVAAMPTHHHVNDLVVSLDVSQIYITAEHVIMMSSISDNFSSTIQYMHLYIC